LTLGVGQNSAANASMLMQPSKEVLADDL
jgi:hypothetical protein